MMPTKSALLFFFTKLIPFIAAQDSAWNPSLVNKLQPITEDTSGGSDVDSFIIQGTNAEVGEYPYYTHMRIETEEGNFSCGGSLIAPDVILSAAHCNDPLVDTNIESGYVGATRFWSTANGAEQRYCTTWKNHPDYVPGEYTSEGYIVAGTTALGGNDFALCKLDQPVNIDTTNVYLELNEDSNFPPNNAVTESMGMGRISPDRSQGTEVLKRTDIEIYSQSNCRFYYYGTLDDTMICTRDKGTGVCSGDSGGPIVVASRDDDGRIKHKQVGIVSWGSGDCGPPFPDVHARVSAGMDWIKSTVCNEFGSNASFCDNAPPTPTQPCENNKDYRVDSRNRMDCAWIGQRPADRCSKAGAIENCPLFCDPNCKCVNNLDFKCDRIAEDPANRCRRRSSRYCPEICDSTCAAS